MGLLLKEGIDTNLIKTWVKEIICSHNKLEGKVFINFVNKRRMTELNLKFLNHSSHEYLDLNDEKFHG